MDVVPLFTSDASHQWIYIRTEWRREVLPAWTIRALAIIGGVGVLRGANWARWLMLAWLLFHVALAATGPAGNLLVHVVIAAGLAHLMFRRDAATFFAARPQSGD
jgi:hypothetical protein